MARYLRLWVSNQSGDGDHTDGYLKAAGATEEEARECLLPATEEGWQRFRALRDAVAYVGHGDESDVDLMAGAEPPDEDPPDLVTYLVSRDEDGWWEEPFGTTMALQVVHSRTAETFAEYLREVEG